MRLLARVRFLLAATLLAIAQPSWAQGEPITVFAAASLKNALEEAAKPFSARTGLPVRFSFAASSALARQIESGAPADLFASADLEWMNHLAERRLVQTDTRLDLLGNSLVVIAPASATVPELALTSTAIQQVLGRGGRITTGEVTSVPVGRYAKAALEKLGLWSEVQPRLAQAENVRAALLFVSRGEAPLGIVYGSDAKADPKVKVVATFPPESHPPITYPFALTVTAKGDGPRRFLSFLNSPEARPFFEAQGFTILATPKPTN
jgi:molybdate transport system substrate-binding protein